MQGALRMEDIAYLWLRASHFDFLNTTSVQIIECIYTKWLLFLLRLSLFTRIDELQMDARLTIVLLLSMLYTPGLFRFLKMSGRSRLQHRKVYLGQHVKWTTRTSGLIRDRKLDPQQQTLLPVKPTVVSYLITRGYLWPIGEFHFSRHIVQYATFSWIYRTATLFLNNAYCTQWFEKEA